MLLNHLLFAASAAAFLVVPEASMDDDAIKALPIDTETYEVLPLVAEQSIAVPCAECKGNDVKLHLDFAVEDGSRLTVNGFELYPTADPWNGDLTASISSTNARHQEQMLGYNLSVQPGPVDAEQGLEIVNVELHVIEVGQKFVDGLPVVQVQLIQSRNDIIIGRVNMMETSEASCTSLLCRLKNNLKETVGSFASKMKGGCERFHNKHGSQGMHGKHSKHGKNKNHGDHRPHNGKGPHHHDWSKLLKNIAANILLPVLMGLTAGVGVAVCSMALCSCLAIFIRTRRSGDRRRCHRAKARITEPAIEEEKTGLMDDQAPPPLYEREQATEQQ